MKKLAILIFFIQVSMIAQNGQKNFIDQNYIELTGTVETQIIPDEIFINIVINERDKRGKVSVETQENQMLQKLKTLGIDVEKQLSILDFTGNYITHFIKKNEVVKSKEYQLIINNTTLLGTLFEVLDDINISNVTIAKVDHSDIENIRRETKLNALKVAKEKATNYAKAIDQNIGKALFIQEQKIPSSFNGLYGSNAANEINIGYILSRPIHSKNNITFQKITITATVLARFELK